MPLLSHEERIQAVGYEGVNELSKIIRVCKKMIIAINQCGNENLAEEVGKFAREMPTFKAFSEEGQQLANIARQVCTKEMQTKRAIEVISTMCKELEETKSLL